MNLPLLQYWKCGMTSRTWFMGPQAGSLKLSPFRVMRNVCFKLCLTVLFGLCSFSAGLGTACGQLCTEQWTDVIWIMCRTPGLTRDQCSPHSKLVGIMAAFWYWNGCVKLLNFAHVQTPGQGLRSDVMGYARFRNPSADTPWNPLRNILMWFPLSRSCCVFSHFTFSQIMSAVKQIGHVNILPCSGGNFGIWRLTSRLRPTGRSFCSQKLVQPRTSDSFKSRLLSSFTRSSCLAWTQHIFWMLCQLMLGQLTGLLEGSWRSQTTNKRIGKL